ncbi:MAG TPA: glycosyltransferase [Candidatus Angelobacter sp.]|nr:glycosyltransferase [Candidatus Angelobacter sp.]
MGNQLKILYVAYPLLTVSETSAGGAEQVLWTLEREMTGRGVATTVAASAGSRVSGELFSTGEPCSSTDDFQRRNREHQKAIIELVRQRTREGRPFDLVHDMSGSFWTRAAEIEVPVLATLHLPRHFYQATQLENVPENVSFNCVSESQARSFSDIKQLAGVVPNGIALDRFLPGHGERNGLLWLGRICEEKGPHLALDIAAQANLPIVIAGQVYPFSYHQQFFAREIEPRLRTHSNVTWIDCPSDELKRKLLRESAALLITSQVDETSSLVAMEAAASGNPVIAFRRGALPEVVKDGVTGFVVGNIDEAVKALQHLQRISCEDCARYARTHFSSAKMADDYQRLYSLLMQREELLKAA